MRKISSDEFAVILKQAANIKPRIKRELRFNASVGALSEDDWHSREVVAISDRSGNVGVLLIQPGDSLYIVSFELGGSMRDSGSGRTKAIICDFCYTWRAGGDAGLVSFYKDSHSSNTTAQLCCLDFECSRNVRTQTKASIMSRAQLREDISPEGRIERLNEHLQAFADKLRLDPM